ncbi:hypothetical protein JV33_12745 [Pectobacterium carotovorum subsp. carotovorum]|nr:hypothetical protein JV33_12745 [Pectobacterium carotovorum subsp. carotovorum]KHT29634.1 hypothetical protein RC98_02120 [Pectobacterium carotovorum subsp. carotovorum]KML69571.1 hypothetical protein G032_11605 [Pectobacterium carotovorum subsp. carotovorum ICMP 5702]
MFFACCVIGAARPIYEKKRADERVLARVNRLSTGIPEVRVAGEEAGGSFSAPHNSGENRELVPQPTLAQTAPNRGCLMQSSAVRGGLT